jgi:hypothetical protein
MSRLNTLEMKRENYDPKWREIAVFADPKNTYFRVKRANGDLSQLIPKMDDTAQTNLPIYAAVLNSMLTPQAYLWHKLQFFDQNMQAQYGPLLDQENQFLYNRRYSAYSNFTSAMNECYMSAGAFGHAIMQIEPDLKHKCIGYHALPIVEFYIDKDAYGFVNIFYRKVMYTMRNLLTIFPDYLPEKYKDRKDLKWLDDKICLIHAVEPSLTTSGRFTSTYIDKTNMQIIEETEMKYCPYLCFRSAVFPSSDDPYGFSPIMSVLPSIKALNSLQFNFMKQTDLVGQPTLLTNSDIIDARKVAASGTVIEGGVDDEGRPMVVPLKAYGELPPMDYIIQKYQDTIETVLLAKYMALMSDTQSRSATDAMIKANERANLVAPSGDRVSREFLLPMIEAEIVIYGDMNVLPQMPAELKGVGFDIVLDNPLLKGQRMDSANSAVALMQYIAQFASVDGSVADALNVEKLVRYLQETMNVPANVMRTPEEIAAIAEQKAQAQQLAQMVEAAPKVGSAMKDMAEAQAAGFGQ